MVYVGSGSLEAFSRARLKLMIITVSPRELKDETVKNFYDYNAGLKNSEKKNLLEKKRIEKTIEDSALIDMDQETSIESQNDSFENNDQSEQTQLLLPINQTRYIKPLRRNTTKVLSYVSYLSACQHRRKYCSLEDSL